MASAYAERARRRQEPAEAKPAMAELGRKLAEQGDPARRIPACLSCHEKPDANPAFPRLSGQSAPYLQSQLRLFVAKTRGGGPYRQLMQQAAEHLEEADIQALAAYFSARP